MENLTDLLRDEPCASAHVRIANYDGLEIAKEKKSIF